MSEKQHCCEAYHQTALTLEAFPVQGSVSYNSPGQIPTIHYAIPLFWPTGHEIRVGFYAGNDWQKHEVKTQAAEWTKYANLEFKFVENGPYDVMIDFAPGASWSVIGVTSKARTFMRQPSMNLGNINPQVHPMERKGLILHQFGHAIGLSHEIHDLLWSHQAVHDHFRHPPNNWDQHQTNMNVFAHCTGHLLKKTFFDHDSIMLNSFPREMFEGGEGGGPSPRELSDVDKEVILLRYPGRDKGEFKHGRLTLANHEGQFVVGKKW
jgi:hypothetical protein